MTTKLYSYILSALMIALGIFASIQTAQAAVLIDRITIKTLPAPTNETGVPDQIFISWNTSESTTGRIDFGITENYTYYNGSSKLGTYHEVTLPNLKSNTTYHYRITATTPRGEVAQTLDQTFKTGKLKGAKNVSGTVQITDIAVSHVGSTYMVVTWKTSRPLTSEVRYSTKEDLTKGASRVSGKSDVTSHEVVIKGVKSGLQYYVQAVSKDKDGNEDLSAVRLVNIPTAPKNYKPEPLQVMDVSPVQGSDVRVTETTALVQWKTNFPGLGQVKFVPAKGSRAKSGTVKELGFSTTEHRVLLLDLVPGTKYTFVVTASDVLGRKAETGGLAFATRGTGSIATTVGSGAKSRVSGVNTTCVITQSTYKKCRDVVMERVKAQELKVYLNKVYRNQVPARARDSWYTLVNAYVYGNYPKEAIVSYVGSGRGISTTVTYASHKIQQKKQGNIVMK